MRRSQWTRPTVNSSSWAVDRCASSRLVVKLLIECAIEEKKQQNLLPSFTTEMELLKHSLYVFSEKATTPTYGGFDCVGDVHDISINRYSCEYYSAQKALHALLKIHGHLAFFLVCSRCTKACLSLFHKYSGAQTAVCGRNSRGEQRPSHMLHWTFSLRQPLRNWDSVWTWWIIYFSVDHTGAGCSLVEFIWDFSLAASSLKSYLYTHRLYYKFLK